MTVCKAQIGLPPYGKVTASSAKKYKDGSSCQPDDGYIMTNKGWCAKTKDGRFINKLVKSLIPQTADTFMSYVTDNEQTRVYNVLV